MPNGGSDCCGTCWLNSANIGAPGHVSHDVESRCVIRNVVIQNPYWTYCANHQSHNLEKTQIPIGPIYLDSGGYPYQRKVWMDSEDSEQVRAKLLHLLQSIQEKPRPEYPSSPKFDEVVILQLGLFKEKRAAQDLRRVLTFDPLAAPAGENPSHQSRIATIARAVEALAQIVGDEASPEIADCLVRGLEEARKLAPYDRKADRLVFIRFHAVKALEHLSPHVAKGLVGLGVSDPNEYVAEAARELQKKMG